MSERSAYLDYLRVFAMAWGIFVHTALLADYGWIEVFPASSYYFRMGTFFAVSGLFAGLLIERRGAAGFRVSRGIAIFVPFIVGVFLLNPLTLLLAFPYHNPGVDLSWIEILSAAVHKGVEYQGPITWYLHLWFLASLLVYIMIAPVALATIDALRRVDALRRFSERIPYALQPLALAACVAVSVLGARVAYMLISELMETPRLLRETMSYFPYYAMGLFLYRSPAMRERVHTLDLPLVVVATALWLLATGDLTEGMTRGALRILQREFTVCTVFFTLLWVFRRHMSRRIPVADVISRSIYSIYVFHFLVIYLLATALARWLTPSASATFWIVVMATFCICLIIHLRLLLRSPALLFCFNGRRAAPI